MVDISSPQEVIHQRRQLGVDWWSSLLRFGSAGRHVVQQLVHGVSGVVSPAGASIAWVPVTNTSNFFTIMAWFCVLKVPKLMELEVRMVLVPN